MSARTLTAYYDLAVGPVSYDFVQFLVRAMLEQQERGCERLHVVIVPDARGVDGMFRNKLHLYDAEEKHWRLWNICIPACRLARASVTLASDWPQARALASAELWPADWDSQSLKNKAHMWGPLVWASRAGRQIPKLKASAHARRSVREWFARYSKPVITMTVRNSNYEPARNTDMQAWRPIAEALRQQYEVIMVGDTADALIQGRGYAELNLDLRLALYQEATMNVQTHGGAAMLCWFSDAPFIMFDAAAPYDEWLDLWKDQGINFGDQLPWTANHQRIVWGGIQASQIMDAARANCAHWPARDTV